MVLFVRPANGVYLAPRVIHMTGKSAIEEIVITPKDMPNLFVEAFSVYDAKIHSEMREIVVPPEKRVLNVKVSPSQPAYQPGQGGAAAQRGHVARGVAGAARFEAVVAITAEIRKSRWDDSGIANRDGRAAAIGVIVQIPVKISCF